MQTDDALVLLVEDDPNDQAFIQRALGRAGFTDRVTLVNDGEEYCRACCVPSACCISHAAL